MAPGGREQLYSLEFSFCSTLVWGLIPARLEEKRQEKNPKSVDKHSVQEAVLGMQMMRGLGLLEALEAISVLEGSWCPLPLAHP